MYDIIGDIHGQAQRLYTLLTQLGYQKTLRGWQHPSRKALFVGDFIDRNQDQLGALHTVRTMVEAGNALAVMGNHEFNAIGWYTKHPQQEGYLRAHSIKNKKQHQAFLQAVGEGSTLHSEWVDWFKTLPLYLSLEGLRVVHACWHPQAIRTLSPYLIENRVKADSWLTLFNKHHTAYKAVEVLLKGEELTLPDGYYFYDKDEVRRDKLRVRWWLSGQLTWQQLAINAIADDCLPEVGVIDREQGYKDKTPVFIGHYWLTGKPTKLTPYVACVDYSAAKAEGQLVAYRWQGESQLIDTHFVAVI